MKQVVRTLKPLKIHILCFFLAFSTNNFNVHKERQEKETAKARCVFSHLLFQTSPFCIVCHRARRQFQSFKVKYLQFISQELGCLLAREIMCSRSWMSPNFGGLHLQHLPVIWILFQRSEYSNIWPTCCSLRECRV